MAGFFPMFVRLAGRIVVVVGGGDLAVRTTEALLEWNVLVSVADELALSDFVVPSFVHRGGLTLALHAGAPDTTLANRVSQDLERALGPEYGDFIAALERARDRINREVADLDLRQTLFERLVRSDLLEVIRHDGASGADARIDALLEAAATRRVG